MVKDHGVHHLGIIMDGNRRWARRHGLPPMAGHQRGYTTFQKMGDWCLDRGIKVLTIYAFSAENWKRSKREVNFLMGLMIRALRQETANLNRKGVRIKVIGRIKELPVRLQQQIAESVAMTKKNRRSTLQVAVNYGGRGEIVDAVKRLIKTVKTPAGVTEKAISDNLYTAGEPDPDLILRTSGEYRLSGFLPWQSVYSELVFVPHLWPDMKESDLDDVLQKYKNRQRRFGS